MTLSVSEPSVGSVGNLRHWWVPGATRPTLAALAAPTTKDITYSFAGDGFNPSSSDSTVTDTRQTRKVNPTKISSSTVTATGEVVATGTESDVARVALAEGTEGWHVRRPFVENEVEPSADDLFELYHVTCGPFGPVKVSGDIQTITQGYSIIEFDPLTTLAAGA